MNLQTNKPASSATTIEPGPAMLRSMTGYAHRSAIWHGWSIGVELRCVNSRYLDLGFRLPDELRAVEPALRELLSTAVKRGKLECRIVLQQRHDGSRQPAVDTALLAGVLQAAATVQHHHKGLDAPPLAPLGTGELLRWPGILREDPVDPQALSQQVVTLTEAALLELQASRAREAGMLRDFVLERVSQIESIATALLEKSPQWIQSHQEQLVKRLEDTLSAGASGALVDNAEVMARVRQEVLMYGIRIDVAEELSRLMTHLTEVRRVLRSGGLAGKRLDFLMQELNREANTLGSKAADIGVTQAAVDCKVAIEQMREQIQNIE